MYVALTPGPFPGFQCSMFHECNVEKASDLGMGLKDNILNMSSELRGKIQVMPKKV